MNSGRYASIDVGTNSAKITIADLTEHAATLVLDQSQITRLGDGMQPNQLYLREVPMRRTLEALEQFAILAQQAKVEGIAVVGTAALRDAQNTAEFLHRVQERTGLPLEVISGEEEARLSYLAVRRDPLWRESTSLVVIDVGGGSTEVILGEHDTILSRMSVNLGAVKITENYLRSDPPTVTQLDTANQIAQEGFAQVPLEHDLSNATVVGVGGTITNLTAMHLGKFCSPEVLHGALLTTDALAEQIYHLSTLSLESRKQIQGLDPKRADIILGGAILLAQALARLETNTLAVSTRGLRWGVLYDRFW